MKTSSFLPIILFSFFSVSAQPYWLLDGYEFPDVNYLRNTFVEPNLNKTTFIIDSRAYIGAGVNLLDSFDISDNKMELFHLKNRCYIDYSRLIEPLPKILEIIIPSACHIGLTGGREIHMKEKYRDSTITGTDTSAGEIYPFSYSIPIDFHNVPVATYSITPSFWLYWTFPNTIINNIRIGIQNICNFSDSLTWNPDFYADVYLGKNADTRNLFRFGFNAIDSESMETYTYTDTSSKEPYTILQAEGKSSIKTDIKFLRLTYEFQHDFEWNLSINAGIKVTYNRHYERYKMEFEEWNKANKADTNYSKSHYNFDWKSHNIYLIPHLAIDYTFPTFQNTISISIFAPIMNYLKEDFIDEDGKTNITERWTKIWSGSVYITMPFWSRPLNVKTER